MSRPEPLQVACKVSHPICHNLPMCGRYRFSRRKQIVEEYLDCSSGEPDWVPRYNFVAWPILMFAAYAVQQPLLGIHRERLFRASQLYRFLGRRAYRRSRMAACRVGLERSCGTLSPCGRFLQGNIISLSGCVKPGSALCHFDTFGINRSPHLAILRARNQLDGALLAGLSIRRPDTGCRSLPARSASADSINLAPNC